MDLLFPLVSLLALMPVLTLNIAAAGSVDSTIENEQIIGAVLDASCRIGKEEKVAMEMAVEDFNKGNNQSLVLQTRNSQREPLQAALAAMDLIKDGAQAILGPETWEETSLVAEIGSRNHIPILSFSDWTAKWATKKWPFLLAVSPNQYAQMKAIASIVQSYEWHQVNIIHEETDNSWAIPNLSDALRKLGVEVNHVVIPPVDYDLSITEQLGRLQREQCRVFVVHLHFQLAVRLFEIAKRMKMMEKDYVWITTASFTNLILSINASTTANTMQGIIGVKSYSPSNDSRFQDFSSRFSKKFSMEHPEESNHEPGFYAMQAYDAIWMVAPALSKQHTRESLVEKIMQSDFEGLTGKVQFVHQSRTPADTFQIINIVGRSYREIGFWSDKYGFSETINHDTHKNSSSMNDLGPVYWPGGPWDAPRGWSLPTDSKPFRIGVPTNATYKEYVNVEYDHHSQPSFSGLAIELFEEAVGHLTYNLTYKLFPFNGKYDELVEQVHLKNFDAAVGDVAITSDRYQNAEFTQPYTQSGLVMIVPARSKARNKAWLFMTPYTKTMWLLIGIINVYNGFVVWLIERKHLSEHNGSAINQTGSLLWLSFSTFFSFQGEKLHSNLSRMTMAMWLFMALILTQIYTAKLASILTIQGLEPAVTSIDTLKNSNAKVGYADVSFVERYLRDVLNFNSKNIRGYTHPEDIAIGLRNKEIAAIFLEVPTANLFLAKYCKGFTIAGPTFHVGGYGFVFPKRSPFLPSITEALLKVSETGKLRQLENSMLASEECVEEGLNDDDEIASLSPNSFWALFLLTGTMSTISLLIYARINWTLMLDSMRSWGTDTRIINFFPVRVANIESPPNTFTLTHQV